jgi:transposase
MAVYVGIDVGRVFHVYSIVEDDGKKLSSGRMRSTQTGLNELSSVLLQYDVALVGMEATGHYWRNLYHRLCMQGYTCSVLNPVTTKYFRRMTLGKHKTDALDADCIARYLAAVRPEGTGPSEDAKEQLRSLCRAQAAIAEQLTATVNRLHRLVDLSFPEVLQHFPKLRTAKALAILEKYPSAAALANATGLADLHYGNRGHSVGNVKAALLKELARSSAGMAQSEADELLVRQTVAQLRLFQEQEKEIQKAIESLLLQEDLGVANLVTVPGVGPKAAAAVVSELGDIRQFETTKKLTGFIGAHPRFNDSGTKIGHATMSKAGNKRLRRILWMCTIVAIRHNPSIKQVYENKLAEGKRKMVAIGHCMNKLIRIIWGVLTYNEPYDPAGGKRLATLAENQG